MFDILKFNERQAVITDRNEVLTYAQLAEEVENFAVHYKGGLVFTLCENLLGSFVGYVACMNKHIPQVLLDGSKDLELVQRLIGIYQPEYIWTPSDRVQEVSEGFKRFKEVSVKPLLRLNDAICCLFAPVLTHKGCGRRCRFPKDRQWPS